MKEQIRMLLVLDNLTVAEHSELATHFVTRNSLGVSRLIYRHLESSYKKKKDKTFRAVQLRQKVERKNYERYKPLSS